MHAVQVGDRAYALEPESAGELLARLRAAEPDGASPAADVERKLRASTATEPARLEGAELAVLGAVIEGWATEVAVDADDVQTLRGAIADELA